MASTESALIARQVDSATAQRLKSAGYNLSKLKQKSYSELINLGLPDVAAKNILSEQRPPIPSKTLNQLLFDNRFQCCVCRSGGKSIIVHHIEEWVDSRDHSLSNLAVLCTEHHSEAHTKRSISLSLTASRIRDFKRKWEQHVKAIDARSIVDALKTDYATWNYMNELRIFDLAKQYGIDSRESRYFGAAVHEGVALSDGLPGPPSKEATFYKYEGRALLQRYAFVSDVFQMLILKLPIMNISDFLDRGALGLCLVQGDYVFVQGKHIFSPHDKKRQAGPGQFCDVTRSANGVIVKATIDRWEATSSSALNVWLSGTRQQGSLLHLKDITREDGKLVLRGTALGICSNQGNLKTREYAGNLWQSGAFRDPYRHFWDEDDSDDNG